MSAEAEIKHFEIVNELLLVSFSDNNEAIINLKSLREGCPCASCSGETDALGNVYKGPKKKLSDRAYQATKFEKIGHYALRIYWVDHHTDGLYTYEILRKLGDS